MHVSLVTPLATTVTFGGIREVRNQFFLKSGKWFVCQSAPGSNCPRENALPHATLIKGGGSFLND